MLFAVFFEDDNAHLHKRSEFMSDHLAFLERNGTTVRAAGPLKAAADGTPAGGLWLVEAKSAEDVRRLCEDDPFWSMGLRKSVQIFEWTRVFAGGKRRSEGTGR
jgi:uncharacterized protein YciI